MQVTQTERTTVAPVTQSKVLEIVNRWVRLGYPIKLIPFNPEWKNTTGYFDHAVKDRSLFKDVSPDTLLWCTDEHSRTLLIAFTQVGNVVIFDRYSHGDKGIVVSNNPAALRPALPSSNWSQDELDHWFSYQTALPHHFVDGLIHAVQKQEGH